MNNKFVFMIVTLVCFVAIGICVIVNVSINAELTWAIYPLLSIIFAWLITAPAILLEQKKRLVGSLAVASILVIPYLFLLESSIGGANWFARLALPISAIGIAVTWICFVAYNRLSNVAQITAMFIFMIGVVFSTAANLLALNFADVEFSIFPEFIATFVCLVLSAIFFIKGYSQKGKNVERGNGIRHYDYDDRRN